MPAQTARTYSEHLLGRFREICEDLELADLYRQSDEIDTDPEEPANGASAAAAPSGSRLVASCAPETWVPEI